MIRFLAMIPGLMAFVGPARAEVVSSTANGFVVRHVADVDASADAAWQQLLKPAEWWSASHTYSGDAANLSLDARAGGCFCEVLPAADGADGPPRGGVEHMRVIYVESGKALRMAGSLGPLQSEALVGTLTITLKPADGGLRMTWTYVVSGFMRYKVEDISPAVDKVLSEQVANLARKLGVRETPAKPAKPGEIGR